MSTEEALEKLTYGYRNDEGEFVVSSLALTQMFFEDFLNSCDNPGYQFNAVMRSVSSQEVMELLKPKDFPKTDYGKKMTEAMASVMRLSRARDDNGYPTNGFTEKFVPSLHIDRIKVEDYVH